jgi:hypothetical protein
MTAIAETGSVAARGRAGKAGSVAAYIAGSIARLFALFAAAIAVWFLLTMVMRPWYSRWGATEAEVTASLPGDALVPNPVSQSTWAVTVQAPPEAIWPWLVQMGWGRGGFYTYEWFENGVLQLGIHNADRIVPEWQDIAIGDHFWYYPEDYPLPRIGPRIAGIERNEALLLCHQVTEDETAWFDGIFDPGYFFMGRGMLEGIQARAEGRTPSSLTNVAIGVLWAVGSMMFAVAALLMVVRAKWIAAFAVAVAGFAVLYLLAIWRPPLWAAVVLDLGLLVALLQVYGVQIRRLAARPQP